MQHDQINPDHYRRFPVEVIDITEHLSFNAGNAVKYLTRAGHKPGADTLTDLQKAAWYVQREIQRITAKDMHMTTNEMAYIIEIRGVYDGWSVGVRADGTYMNRWADPTDPSVARDGYECRFAATQAWIDKQDGEPDDHE